MSIGECHKGKERALLAMAGLKMGLEYGQQDRPASEEDMLALARGSVLLAELQLQAGLRELAKAWLGKAEAWLGGAGPAASREASWGRHGHLWL
jgi:hypothetical protein